MRRLVFQKRHQLNWEEAPEPGLSGANQAIVRPLAIARCDLDIPILSGQTLFRPPFPIGHEFVGEIAAISEDQAARFPIGSRVVVTFQASCGVCPLCAAGLSKSCSTVTPTAAYGMPPGAKEYGGALADRVFVPFASQMLLPFSANVDPAAIASLSDNIVEAWKMVGRGLKRRPGGSVLIVGGLARSIGLYSALLAKSLGAGRVIYLDTMRENLDLAAKLGLEIMEAGEFPKSAGSFDVVADCSAVEAGWRCALRSLAPGGYASSASIFWTNKLELPYLELYNNGAELHIGRVDSRETIPFMLELIESGQYDPGPVVTATAALADAREAWLEPGVKLVVTNY